MSYYFLLVLTSFCLIAWVLDAGSASADEAYRRVVTSAEESRRSESFQHSGQHGAHRWSVTQKTLHGGKQEGVELITIDNGKLQIDIIPTRGMGVLAVRAGDVRMGWDSPIKDVVHPQYVNLDTRGGLGWLEGFNELMVRCGLEFAGGPGPDEFITNTGATATMDLTLHGKIANIPASEVEVIVDAEAPHRIRVRGVVYEHTFHGPKLEMIGEISTTPGADSFRIHDQVINHSANDQEVTLIYHTNFGAPILDAGAKLHAAAKKVRPINAHAAKALDHYATYAGPTDGFVEEVYLIEPYSDDKGRTSAVLANSKGNLAATMHWSVSELPYLTQWKNTVAEGDGYVTGIEPGTCYPLNRSAERAAGRLAVLKGRESRSITVDIGLRQGAEEVAAAIQEVEALMRGRETDVIESPEISE